MSVDSKEILQTFGPSPSLSDEIVAKISTLKSIFNLSTEDIFLQWETYNVTEVKENLDLSLSVLDNFQEYLQRHLASKNTPSVKKSRDLGSALKRRPLKPLNSSSPITENFHTPGLKVRKVNDTPFKTPGMGPDSSPSNFETANNTFRSPLRVNEDSHTVLETMNPQLTDLDSTESAKVQIAANFDAAKYKFRTMSMKLLENADLLDDQIDTFAQLYQETHKNDELNFGNPCLSSQFEIHCCGRIVPDSPLYDKLLLQDLNATSLYLETSRLSGIGQRIPLDLSHLKEYSLFPGQIVCLKGKNPTGSTFIVEEVLKLPELGAPVTSELELKEFKDMVGEAGGLKFVVASGPFSNLVSLNYDKFSSFVDHINTVIKPNVVILFGPFVDLNNKAVSEGDIEVTADKSEPLSLDDVFRKSVTPILKRIDSNIQVILLPSLRDASIKHCSYPQDSFDRKLLGLPKNIKTFPNPSGFSINEVLFGCSNLDVFKDLKDVNKVNPDIEKAQVFTNRFERIANHIFDQRRYTPHFPGSIAKKPLPKPETEKLVAATDGLMAEEVVETKIGSASLEVSYLGLAELGDSLPDVLIIPSEMKYFAKVVRNVLTINPGSFIRPSRDASREEGSYVVMHTRGPDTEELGNVEKVQQDLDVYYHNVFERTKVNIMKS